MSSRSSLVLYELGARAYAWATGQAGWRASCDTLAGQLPSRPACVLDLGCGPGGVLAAIGRQRPGARVVGVDVAARMLTEARRAGATLPSASLVRADAVALPFPAGAFDAVTSHSFLYLAPDRAAVLAEAARVLRPGGRLLLVEPWAGRVSWLGVLAHCRDPRFLLSVGLWRTFNRLQGRFRAADLAALLRAQGFAAPAGMPVLGGLGVLARAEKPVPAAAEQAAGGPLTREAPAVRADQAAPPTPG
jgi:SAM-dependent methyltransferase